MLASLSWLWPGGAAAPSEPGPARRSKQSAVYEALFNGLPVAGHAGCQSPAEVLGASWQSSRFWDEMLLLRVDAPFLRRYFASTPPEQLLATAAPAVTQLVCVCTRYLDDANLLRISHALETLQLVFHSLAAVRFTSTAGASSMHALRVAAGGTQHSARVVGELLTRASRLAVGEAPEEIRRAALRLLLVLCGSWANVNANVLVGLCQEAPAEALQAPLLQLLTSPSSGGHSEELQEGALQLLALLLSWTESSNAFSHRLAACPAAQLAELLHVASRALAPPPPPPPLPPTDAQAQPAGIASLLSNAYAYVVAATASDGAPLTALGVLTRGTPCLPAAPPRSLAGALLLHALAQQSGLLRSHAAWVPQGALAQPWHACLAAAVAHAAQLAKHGGASHGGGGADGAAAAAAAEASRSACGSAGSAADCAAALTLHAATLRLVVEDPRGAEFVASTDVQRLVMAHGSAAAAGGAAAMGAQSKPAQPQPLSDALVELAASALTRCCRGDAHSELFQGGASTLLLCAHTLLHAAARRPASSASSSSSASAPSPRGARVAPSACTPLWRACAAQLRRFAHAAHPEAELLSARLAAQAAALLSLALAAAPAVLGPPGAPREALLECVLALRPHLGALAQAVEQAGVQHPDDVDASADEDTRRGCPPRGDDVAGGGGGWGWGVRAASTLTPRVHLRPLRDTLAAFPDVQPDALAANVWGRSGLLPRLQLARADGCCAAGDAPREGLAWATGAASRAICAAARGGDVLPTGAMDQALLQARTGVPPAGRI